MVVDQGLIEEVIEDRMEVGLMTISVMQQALAQGLSFIAAEMDLLGLVDTGLSSDYGRYFVTPSTTFDEIDRVRLLVLTTFDQIFMKGDIGIGVGTGFSSEKPGAIRTPSKDYNRPSPMDMSQAASSRAQESRRERRRKLDRFIDPDEILDVRNTHCRSHYKSNRPEFANMLCTVI